MLCQFHLRLSLSSLGTHGKDVEYERGSVKNLHLQFLFNITYLLGREFIIENHHTHRLGSVRFIQEPFSKELGILLIKPVVVSILTLFDILLDFLQFSTSYISCLTRSTHFLGKTFHRHSTCCVG